MIPMRNGAEVENGGAIIINSLQCCYKELGESEELIKELSCAGLFKYIWGLVDL